MLIVKIGRAWIHVLDFTGRKVRVTKIRIAEAGLMWPATHYGKPYPVRRAGRIYRKLARDHGITDEAQRALQAL